VNGWFLAAYLILGGALLTVELIGALVRKKTGDTITEAWRSLDARLHGAPQWTYRVLTVGVLTWTILHLAHVW